MDIPQPAFPVLRFFAADSVATRHWGIPPRTIAARARFRYRILDHAFDNLHLLGRLRVIDKLRGWKMRGHVMNRVLQAALLASLFCCAPAMAQTRPQEGGHEIQIWAAGGHGTNGSTSSDSVFNAGARFGWILTKAHGKGFVRGKFEYAVDAVPVFLVFQPANKAYGAGFNPVVLKWNFETDSRVVPYVELGGGVLFTNVTVPTGTSQTNFTSGAAVGVHILGEKVAWSADLRYMHISNAGLTTPNPGINTVQVRVGVGWFTRGWHK